MKPVIAFLLSVSLVLSSNGCATLLRGTSQSIVVKTTPPGRSVLYQGRKVADGEMVLVQKQFEPPRFYVGAAPVDMHYDPDSLLLGDAGLLLFFVVPGLIALGVDFGTGAWRNLHSTQMIAVPDSVAISP